MKIKNSMNGIFICRSQPGPTSTLLCSSENASHLFENCLMLQPEVTLRGLGPIFGFPIGKPSETGEFLSVGDCAGVLGCLLGVTQAMRHLFEASGVVSENLNLF